MTAYLEYMKGKEGPKGDKGDRGDQGPAGLPGKDGAKGEKGDKGDQGEKGEKGDKGDPGEAGPQGPEGPQGPQGPEGPQGPQGPEGQQGPKGEDGKSFVRKASSGNIAFNYGDNPARESSTGMFGSSMYLKTTLTLNNAPAGSSDVMFDIRLRELPCTEDGTLVSYSIDKKLIYPSAGDKAKVEVWFTFPTPPTHMIDPSSK